MKQRIALFFLLSAYLFGVSHAYALPFQRTPKSFEHFVNEVWRRGVVGNTHMGITMRSSDTNESRAYFGFYSCEYTPNPTPQRIEDFDCSGYVDTITPIRRTRCNIRIMYTLGTSSESEARAGRGDPNATAGWYGSMQQYALGPEYKACASI